MFLEDLKEKINTYSVSSAFYSNFFLIFEVLAMDIYVLGRIFRDFDGSPQKNVIINAGKFHIDNYVTYLKTRGFKQKYISKVESERCQIIPNILK